MILVGDIIQVPIPLQYGGYKVDPYVVLSEDENLLRAKPKWYDGNIKVLNKCDKNRTWFLSKTECNAWIDSQRNSRCCYG